MGRQVTVEEGCPGPGLRGWEDRQNVRVVALHLNLGERQCLNVRILRKVAWLEECKIAIGGMAWLDLEHVGARGWFEVVGIAPCPELEPGDGWLVTGTMRFSTGRVLELRIQGEEQPIGVTPLHPIWSVDRDNWVAAEKLLPGESLLARDGAMPLVECSTLRIGEEAVYNCEVEVEHCFLVGSHGVLVHNSSQPGQPAPCDPCDVDIRIDVWQDVVYHRNYSIPRCAVVDRLRYPIPSGRNAARACQVCNRNRGTRQGEWRPEQFGSQCDRRDQAASNQTPSPEAYVHCDLNGVNKFSVFCCPCCDVQGGVAVVLWYCRCPRNAPGYDDSEDLMMEE